MPGAALLNSPVSDPFDASAIPMDRRKALTLSPPVDRPGGSCGGNPYKIPKRKSASESLCVQFDSPLSRLAGVSCHKMHWTQFAGKTQKSDGFSSLNGKACSNHSQMPQVNPRNGLQARLVLTDVLKTELGRGYLARRDGHQLTEIRQTQPPACGPERESAPRDAPSSVGRVVTRTAQTPGDQTGSVRRPAEDLQGQNRISGSEDLDAEIAEEVRVRRHVPGSLRAGGRTLSGGDVLQRSNETPSEGVGAKRICLEGLGGQPAPASQVKGDPLGLWPESQPEVGQRDAGSEPSDRRRRTLSVSGLRKPKPSPTEPIVLSSDEEDEEGGEGGLNLAVPLDASSMVLQPSIQPQGDESEPLGELTEEDRTTTDMGETSSPAGETSSQFSSVMELAFSTLHMGRAVVQANGNIMITNNGITIPLKDSSGAVEVELALTPSQLRRYGAWGAEDGPALSFLFLWVSDTQAQLIQLELSVISSVELPEQASSFVLLTLREELSSVQGSILAMQMELMSLCSGGTDLMQPFSWSQGLELIQSSAQDAHLLSVLGQDLQAVPNAQAGPESSSPQGILSVLPRPEGPIQPEPGYTLSHRRTQSSYVVSLAPRPGAPWSRYKHQGPPRRLILFPPPPSKGGITVTTEDLECLDCGQFLNDVIIDFYLKYLLLEKAPRAVAERSHVFSSFFYKQLTRKDSAGVEAAAGVSAQHRRHQRVKTWTRHVDIFNKDYLFVPVNKEAHWYLVVICFPGLEEPRSEKWSGAATRGDRGGEGRDDTQDMDNGKLNGVNSSSTAGVEAVTGGGDPAQGKPAYIAGVPECTQLNCQRETVWKRPCILLMDSLKSSFHERICKLLREYLQVEWEVRRGTPREFTPEQMKGSQCRVPLQDNSSDCGLYLLQFAESFLEDPVVHFDLPLRLESWFPRQQVRRKRDEIRDLVLWLYRKQMDCSSSK